jgi:predicted hotdog family 3-hydroxylacyl-ACP dehydratase
MTSDAVSYPPISDLVPHGEAIILLDELIRWEPGFAVCRTRIEAGKPLTDPDGMDAVVSLEMMGQAIAVCLGYEAFREGAGVRVGMIVGLRHMVIDRDRLEVGEEFEVVARRLRGNSEVSTFETQTLDLKNDRARVATALMTVVHAEKPPK